MSQYNRYERTNFTEHNSDTYMQNDYQNAYNSKFNQQLSAQSEPNIHYEEFSYYLTVSSKDRDINSHPSVNSYTITFPKDFKNIKSIELIQAIIPDKNNVTAEPYLLLKIDELEDVMVSTNKYVSDAFAILQLAPPTTTGGFIQIDKRIHENTTKFFKNPKASLSKMTISITNEAGELFNFGAGNSKGLQNTFVFKIVCLEKERSVLSHRNVF